MLKAEGFHLRNIIVLINSLLKTAKANVSIVELDCYKEQIVIGFPQVESLESELKTVETSDECESGARYLMLATLASGGHLVPIYVRFYLTSNGKLIIEDSGDDGITLANPEEFNQPERWKKIIENTASWGSIIVRLILSYFGYPTDGS